MSGGSLRQRLEAAEPLLGTWAALDSAYAVELVGSVGFDWICVDLQHGVAAQPDLPGLLQAASAAGVPALVRTPIGSLGDAQRALDLGAAGVIAPFVESAAEAAAVAASCRYAPDGRRSWGPLRPLADGAPAGVAGDPLCVVMVETARGVEAVEEIAGVPGIDAVFVGPADLSLSTSGRLGSDLGAELAVVAAACRRAGIAAGIACPDERAAATAYAAGFRLLTLQWDVGFLAAGAGAALVAAREATAAVSAPRGVE
jgi:4-hydroxy-2-oxoheptanedioate aldolase